MDRPRFPSETKGRARLKLVDLNPAANWGYAKSLARAFAGAIVFSLPLLMTMELWFLGFYLDRWKLFQFVAINLAVLVGLSRVSGFEPTTGWADDVLDAFSAYAVAFVSSAAVLSLFGVIGPGLPLAEIVGKVAIQCVPASFGAMIASKQLGEPDPDKQKGQARSSYPAELFMMVAGALFLSFNVAPTEEVALIAFKMTAWHSLALIAVSIFLLHVLVYSVGFRGEEQPAEASGFVAVFLHFSITGYALVILVSLYVLWIFGRTEGTSLPEIAAMTAVLAFPGAVGAAIARLVL